MSPASTSLVNAALMSSGFVTRIRFSWLDNRQRSLLTGFPLTRERRRSTCFCAFSRALAVQTMSSSLEEHRVAVAVKAIALLHRVPIRFQYAFAAAEGADEHEE